MDKSSFGEVHIINLPGVGSLLSRSRTIYRALFGKLTHLSILFTLGILANLSINSFLSYVSISWGGNGLILMHIGSSIVTLIALYYYAFIFAGMILLVRAWALGKPLSVAHALELGMSRFKSLLWAFILLTLAVSGSLPTYLLTILFTVWYYFAIYIVILEDERGVAALAKSRYLTHGIFFKTLGRYIALTVIVSCLAYLVSLTLAIHAIGGYLFLVSLIVAAILSFPYFTIYEYLRYEDVLLLKRDQPFIEFSGERKAIITWCVIGSIFLATGWLGALLGPTATQKIQQSLGRPIAQAILPLTLEFNKNIEKIGPLIQKFNYTYEPVQRNVRDIIPPVFQKNPETKKPATE